MAVAMLVTAAAVLTIGDSLISGFAVLAALLLGAALALPVLLGFVLRVGERSTRRPLVMWFWADSRQQLPGLSLALMALLLALAVNVGVGTMVESFRRRSPHGWTAGSLRTSMSTRVMIRRLAISKQSCARGPRSPRSCRAAALRSRSAAGRWRFLASPITPPIATAGHCWSRGRMRGMTSSQARAPWSSEQLARRLKLRLGGPVGVSTPTGNWPLRIAAIYADYGNPKGQIAVNIDAFDSRFPDLPRTRFGLRVTPGKIAPLIDDLRRTFHLDESHLSDQSTLKVESTRIFNRTFAVTAALNTFTLGVAGVALLTSLLTLSNSRLPQLAPLWALGLTRRQLAGIELLKTMSVAFITALLALPLGLLVAWCLIAVVNVRAFGWRLPFHIFPLHLVELLGVAMLASLLAMLVPVVRLIRMPPATLIKVFADER